MEVSISMLFCYDQISLQSLLYQELVSVMMPLYNAYQLLPVQNSAIIMYKTFLFKTLALINYFVLFSCTGSYKY